MQHDTVVIGGRVAGLQAALTLGRARRAHRVKPSRQARLAAATPGPDRRVRRERVLVPVLSRGLRLARVSRGRVAGLRPARDNYRCHGARHARTVTCDPRR